MAQIKFTPKTVIQTKTRLVLRDETASQLTLVMPNTACAKVVFAALMHNLKEGET